MNKPKIVRPEESQPAHAVWFDRKKYVTVNFRVQKPRDVQVDIQTDKMILCCKNDTDDVIYNELYFYEKVQIHPSWISVDFDNWRDWEDEEEDGREEYEKYVDMIQDMATSNKGATPDMGDLSDSD
nr:putative protein PTGES3L [Nerophis lumbriciformis]